MRTERKSEVWKTAEDMVALMGNERAGWAGVNRSGKRMVILQAVVGHQKFLAGRGRKQYNLSFR